VQHWKPPHRLQQPFSFALLPRYTRTATELRHAFHRRWALLWTIFAILLIGWLLGLVGVYQIGQVVWLLLAAAVVVLILQLVSGRRTIV